jgi:alpha-tubulin suppressor-like RCC1 family protein
MLVLALSANGCGDPLSAPPPGFVYSSVTTGNEHTCGLSPDGGVFCWGAGTRGELGDSLARGSTKPVRVRIDRTVLQVSSGGSHSCLVSRALEVFCWGWNVFGQLGLGSSSNQGVPVRVSPDRPYRSVSAGWYHSCALSDAGAAYCWGRNDQGQLGNGQTADSTVPVAVAGGLRFASISAGGFHTCGITVTDATAYCWGLNHLGQLGAGDAVSSREPRRVAGNMRFHQVSAGLSHSCGVAQQAAYCWGSSVYGELGTGALTGPLLPGSTVPELVEGIRSVRDISAGVNVSCAAADDFAFCWGRGQFGQLGIGSHWDYSRPQRVLEPGPAYAQEIGTIGFETISARGLRHACGIGNLGDVYCWGEGGSGQLGSGHGVSLVPLRVMGERR